MLLHCWRLSSDPLKFKNNEELHIFSNNNKDVIDIPNVTLASNEDKGKHSEHDTSLQNNSNKLFIKPKHILVATLNNKNTRNPSNDTDEDEEKKCSPRFKL